MTAKRIIHMAASAAANGGMPSYLVPTLHTYYKAITLCLHLHPNQPRVSKSDFQICSTYPGRPPWVRWRRCLPLRSSARWGRQGLSGHVGDCFLQGEWKMNCKKNNSVLATEWKLMFSDARKSSTRWECWAPKDTVITLLRGEKSFFTKLARKRIVFPISRDESLASKRWHERGRASCWRLALMYQFCPRILHQCYSSSAFVK